MQLKFGFAVKAAFAESDFVVSTTNREAFFRIRKWPEWPGGALYLYGPKASGKTHLAHIWSQKSGARFIENAENIPAGLPADPALVLENIESFSDQKKLLHLLNEVREKKGSLLITAEVSAAALQFTLPDLTSRIKAIESARLDAPDDALLKSVIAKLFSDRQLKVPGEIIDFLISRIDRSFKSARIIVEKIDNLSALEKRNITLPLVRRVVSGV